MIRYFVLLIFIFIASLHAETTKLILNQENRFEMPRNFRVASSWGLKASASGQFSENGLQLLLRAIPASNIIIVDLREESHGFINGTAVSWRGEKNWTNRGKSSEEISADQEQKLFLLQQEGLACVHLKDDPDWEQVIMINSVATEENTVAKTDARYFHLPTTDYLHPSDAVVDRFLDFVRALPEGTWLHFHCAAGKGRSTTFLAMYDMWHNAHNSSLRTIFERQKEIGGSDFYGPVDPTLWKYPYTLAKRDFLSRFYIYCRTDRSQPWSEHNK